MSSTNSLTTLFVEMCRKDMADSFDDAESLDQVSNLARGTFEKFLALHPAEFKAKAKPKPRMKASSSDDSETPKPRRGKAKGSDADTVSSGKLKTKKSSDTESISSTKKTKKQKDPSAPRKLSGYNMFVNYTMKNHPDFLLPAKPVNEGDAAGVPCKDRMKLCGSMWKGLSDADRHTWNEKAVAKNVESGATASTVSSSEPVQATTA